MKIYTRTGDFKQTSVIGGGRISKALEILDVLGSLDELNANIGLILSSGPSKLNEPEKPPLLPVLNKIQKDLFEIGAEIAQTNLPKPSSQAEKKLRFRLGKSHTRSLEKSIDLYTKKLDELRSFILPGGSEIGSKLHIARAICRRTERHLVKWAESNKINLNILSYINRLSDLLFTLARYSNKIQNVAERTWPK